MNINPPSSPKNVLRWIGLAFAGIFLLVVILSMSITISGGEAGVLFRTFGGGIDLETTYGEGFHIIAPWNEMVVYEVRQQEAKETMAVLSSNGLEISIDVSGWFQPMYSKLPKLHQEKGTEYLDRVVRPAVRSATRSVIGRYTPEEIYSSKRDVIQNEIYLETKKILDKQFVQLNEVLVRDITLPETLKAAIENKLKQEQESLEYEFKLSKAQKEAERQLIDAEGKARANRILSASLTDMILREKGISATLELARSPNAKVVVVGNKDGMPLILGNQ
ncbi:MAG: prohibitin family protein [Bacteroidetes bacterium]|nr:prohibitin family protein [Bacteroidota bacterium]